MENNPDLVNTRTSFPQEDQATSAKTKKKPGKKNRNQGSKSEDALHSEHGSKATLKKRSSSWRKKSKKNGDHLPPPPPIQTRLPEMVSSVETSPPSTSLPPPGIVEDDNILFSEFNKAKSVFENMICSVNIHRVDELQADERISHPLIKISILDMKTGKLVQKSDEKRNASLEKENDIGFVLPVMTKPFDIQENHTLAPEWNEKVLLNEDYLYLLNSNTIMFFELLDFLPLKKTNNKERDLKVWYPIAWCFMKLVSRNQKTNTERKARLQMYRYPKASLFGSLAKSKSMLMSKLKKNSDDTTQPFPKYFSNLWSLWKKKREKYPCSLYVTVEGIPKPTIREIYRRPSLPTDIELGKLTFDQMMNPRNILEGIGKTGDIPIDNSQNMFKWKRLPGQRCRIPNKLLLKVDAGPKGCSCIAFSKGGLYLAAACSSYQNWNEFPIKVFNVITGERTNKLFGHEDIIYDMEWANDDTKMASASSDGSIRIWFFSGTSLQHSCKVIHHPCYVYTVKFHPSNSRFVFTGSFDCLIRAWDIEEEPNKPLVFSGHTSHVNCLVFETDGKRFYSCDGAGILKVWSHSTFTSSPVQDSTPLEVTSPTSYDCIKTVQASESGAIHWMKMHPSNRRLLLHFRNGNIKTFDLRIYRSFVDFYYEDVETRTENSKESGYSEKTRKASNIGIHEISPHPLSSKSVTHPQIFKSEPRKPFPEENCFLKSDFSGCSSFVYSGGQDNRVYVWNTDIGKLIATYDDLPFTSSVNQVAFHPHDNLVAMCSFGDYQPLLLYTKD